MIKAPKRMMQMRARAWALRDVFPDVLRGVHVAEEAQDIPPERSMGPAHVVDDAQPTAATRTESVKEKLRAQRQKEQPMVSVDQVLARIEGAATEEALTAVGDLATSLPEADRARVRTIYAAKMREIRAVSTEIPAESMPAGDAGEREPGSDDE